MAAQPTPAEAKLWEILEPMGFGRQVVITVCAKNGGRFSYILDFAWPVIVDVPKLCVEVDGGVHNRQKGRDRRRDTRLRGEGITTIRLKNKDVLAHPAECGLVVKVLMDSLRDEA
jgi:very-short-patch-repair endonuclease